MRVPLHSRFLWALVAEDYESTFQVRQVLFTIVALIQEHARATATTTDPMREVGPYVLNVLWRRAGTGRTSSAGST